VSPHGVHEVCEQEPQTQLLQRKSRVALEEVRQIALERRAVDVVGRDTEPQ